MPAQAPAAPHPEPPAPLMSGLMSAVLSRTAGAPARAPPAPPGCPPHPLLEARYAVGEKLGRGCFATVYKGVRRSDALPVAVKVIDKTRLDGDTASLLQNELEVLRAVSEHPGIVTLLDSIDTDANMYFVMEYVDGGPLLDRIVSRGSFSENDARILLRATLLTLKFLSELGCVHRDIKPENILVDNYSKAWPVKLTDFGLSAKMQPDKRLYQTLGTPLFVAPEILSGRGYDCACDMWSLGVVIYLVLCGYPPFPYDNPKKLVEAIIHGDYSFPAPEWDHVSDDAKDALRRMMEVDPEKRISPADALMHPWFHAAQSTSDLPNSKLKSFNALRKFKASVVAVRTTVDLMKTVKSAFSATPKSLTQAELMEDVEKSRALIQAMGIQENGTSSSEGSSSQTEIEQPVIMPSRRSLVLPMSIFEALSPESTSQSSGPSHGDQAGNSGLLCSASSIPWSSQVMSSRAKAMVAELRGSPDMAESANPFLIPVNNATESTEEASSRPRPNRTALQLDLGDL